MATPADNKRIVLEAFDALFNRRDYETATRYWSPNYLQHSAHIEPGRDGLFNLVKAQPDTLRYENALVVADGDFLILHGRFTGHGRPRAWVAADIVRMQDGVLAEHWDVLQDEATRSESRSGLPMFGTSFANQDPFAAASPAASSLTPEQAREIVAPLYEALNQPAKNNVSALLAKACHAEYRSYSTNQDWLDRDRLAEVFAAIGLAVPDLRWTIEDILTFRDQIVVRGEATGTPTGDLFGTKPTGKSFRTISIDIFTAKDGKLTSAYHVENWLGALQQLNK